MTERVTALAAARFPAVEVHFHPQCYLSSGHFAGADSERAAAFVDVANDPSFDALWFGRGGYGSGRIAEAVLPKLNAAAWRSVNLAVHLASMVVLYALVLRVTRKPMVGAIAAAIFGVSGAHFDTVTYITALPHVLAR